MYKKENFGCGCSGSSRRKNSRRIIENYKTNPSIKETNIYINTQENLNKSNQCK